MHSSHWRSGVTLLISAAVGIMFGGQRVPAAAGPVNPQVFKTQYDAAAKDAELVAKVRVVAAACTAAAGEGKIKTVTLQLSLQVLESEKGSAKKNDVLVV